MASAINGESIYNAAASCSHLFEQYVQTFGPTTGKLDLAEDLQGQFNLWAAYIGAITTTKSSLDARLVGQDGLKSMILELLIMIRDNLKHELDTKLDSVATLAESIDGIPESLPLLLGLRAVHVAVRRLHALGRLIQRSMAKECQERQFFDSQHQDDSRCFKDFVKIKFPNATQGLISQLSQSICIRKRSIFYQQQNGMNSVIGREYSLSRPQSKEHITRASENVEMEVPANHHTTSTSEDIFISEAAGFHINVQELHSSLEKSKATHFHSNENPSIREIQNEEFSYPNMPIAAKDELNAMCPICSKSLEVVSLTRRMWNVHIDQDIEPYVCISEECKQPPRFFAHIQDWETHMHIKHGVDWARNIHAITWCCEMDHSEENVDKKIFDDKSDFIHHLSTAHGKNLTKPQILAKSRRSRKFQPRGAFTCPLCNCCPKEIASRLAEEPYSLLSEHISRHLKALAFASLFDLTYEHQKPSSSRGRQITGGQDRADGPTTTHLTSEEPFANIQPTIVEEPRRPSDDQMLPESPEPESPVISPRVHSKPLEISERFAVVSSNNTVSQQEQSPEKIYEQMMETIGSRGPTTKRLAWRLISWLTCSMRPMTVLELQHALAVEAGDNSLLKNNIPKIEDMVSACGGYLTITTDMNTLQFTNEALGKWLEKTWYARFPNAHDYITDICVTYLGFDTFETGFSDSDNAFEKRLRSYALYHYAAQKWGWHARVSSTKENPSIRFR
ncbi:hypothetical protein M431DRAFT_298062 [Trichoderma harzianum CBS 226.95]|uniref:GPI inositol-deacylase winged helix domain-containing protein n=1 Tax=Trichoderma harzianum CBS 226.95 TaxID=983964 RepID=A0A2T4AQ99_TRIHA|nr:hypothetical protein M431DRAFT_298062 [Trichoderma harzianum CBS 226.95]PTB59237.1 hypothetical protein M431DRAFT_298062 [Trichoderma harzianum CBS 226.95]